MNVSMTTPLNVGVQGQTLTAGISRERGAEIQPVLRELERVSLAFDRKLKFVVDRESREVIVKVIDRDTDKVVKELPSAEIQRLRDRIREAVNQLTGGKP